MKADNPLPRPFPGSANGRLFVILTVMSRVAWRKLVILFVFGAIRNRCRDARRYFRHAFYKALS